MNKIKKIIIRTVASNGQFVRSFIEKREYLHQFLFLPSLSKWRVVRGIWKAYYVFERAKKFSPAYKDFIEKNMKSEIRFNGLIPVISDIPEMDKENYIKKYSIEERCLYGKIPNSGVVIDESSGSSGMPNNWVRGYEERIATGSLIKLMYHKRYGNKQIIFINAFALGPWATGLNVHVSFSEISLVKSTGPDLKKIINTLKFFGSKYEYVIAGYPPFLKQVADSTEINWKDYEITCFYGGEGLSEELRQYMHKAFKECYGSYGASDLEINIGLENDFTIALRREMIKNPEFFDAIGKRKYGVPMLFQYNPLDYYIESNEHDELLITICRKSNIAPKIRYNIHDWGHTIKLDELKKICKKFNIDFAKMFGDSGDLPIMFLYGRSDNSVSYFGSKVTPGSVEANIFSLDFLKEKVSSYMIMTEEVEDRNKQLTIAIELKEGEKASAVSFENMTRTFFENLQKINQDFNEAMKMVPSKFYPKLELFEFETGPFHDASSRIKKKYITEKKS